MAVDGIGEAGVYRLNKTSSLENEIKEEEKKAFIDTKAFKEQCFLVDNLLDFIGDRPSTTTKYHSRLEGNPSTFVSQLTAKPSSIKSFLQITPEEYGFLQPKLKIFKALFNNVEDIRNRTNSEFIEFKFNDHTEPTILSNTVGNDVGIKSCKITTTGTNYDTSHTVECELVFFFQNASDLLRSDGPENTRYSQLISQPIPLDKLIEEPESFKERSFQILLNIGWQIPDDTTNTITPELKKALEISNLTLFLNLIKYDLHYRQDGALEATINYRGAIELALGSPPSADILNFGVSTNENVEHSKKELKTLLSELEILEKTRIDFETERRRLKEREGIFASFFSTATKDLTSNEVQRLQELRALKTTAEEEILNPNLRTFKYKKFIETLLEQKKVYYFDIDATTIKDWQTNITGRISLIKEKYDELTEAEKKNYVYNTDKELYIRNRPNNYTFPAENGNETIKNKLNILLKERTNKNQFSLTSVTDIQRALESNATTAAAASGDRRVHYVYLGDIIDIAASLIENFRQSEKIDIVTGPIRIIDHRTLDWYEAHLDDIPISLNLFMQWFMKLLTASQRNSLTFRLFIKKLIDELIAPSTGRGCFDLDYDINMGVNFLILTGMTDLTAARGAPIDISDLIDQTIERTVLKVETPISTNNAGDLWHYMIIHPYSSPPSHLVGDEDEDLINGIYHYFLGSSSGLVKEIRFTKNEIPGASAAQYIDKETQKNTILRRERFNAEIEMYGNNLHSLGSLIYINPILAGYGDVRDAGSFSRTLGLGGYYKIIKISLNLGRDIGYETTIECAFDAFPLGRSADVKRTNNNGT